MRILKADSNALSFGRHSASLSGATKAFSEADAEIEPDLFSTAEIMTAQSGAGSERASFVTGSNYRVDGGSVASI